MGAPIGRHLLAAGTPLAVFDPSVEAVRALAEAGAVACTGPAEVAASSDLVLVVVVDDAQVREAVDGCLQGVRSGTVVAICASVRPDTCRELARTGAEREVEVIDAALVRGERGAEEGKLVLFCGGPAAVRSPARTASSRLRPGARSSTFAGGSYSATCSTSERTHVIESRSTPYLVARIPRAQTPVVTV